MEALLHRIPSQRLGAGAGDAEAIKGHLFFRGLDFEAVFNKQVPPGYTPEVRPAYAVADRRWCTRTNARCCLITLCASCRMGWP